MSLVLGLLAQFLGACCSWSLRSMPAEADCFRCLGSTVCLLVPCLSRCQVLLVFGLPARGVMWARQEQWESAQCHFRRPIQWLLGGMV